MRTRKICLVLFGQETVPHISRSEMWEGCRTAVGEPEVTTGVLNTFQPDRQGCSASSLPHLAESARYGAPTVSSSPPVEYFSTERSGVEGSAVRPAALSILPRKGSRSNESPIKTPTPNPISQCGSQHSFVQQNQPKRIDPRESTNQLIWTALAENSPGCRSWVHPNVNDSVCAALLGPSRMLFLNATSLNRKSAGV